MILTKHSSEPWKNWKLWRSVVKPTFGGSGYGFRIIKKGKKLCPKEIETLIKHGGVVIEPWCKRLRFFKQYHYSKEWIHQFNRHQICFQYAWCFHRYLFGTRSGDRKYVLFRRKREMRPKRFLIKDISVLPDLTLLSISTVVAKKESLR